MCSHTLLSCSNIILGLKSTFLAVPACCLAHLTFAFGLQAQGTLLLSMAGVALKMDRLGRRQRGMKHQKVEAQVCVGAALCRAPMCCCCVNLCCAALECHTLHHLAHADGADAAKQPADKAGNEGAHTEG